MRLSAVSAKKELTNKADPEKASILQRFFKTGKGEYGEGDVFIGITVPEIRKTAGKFADMELAEIEKLLHSKIHEERLLALLILIRQFGKSEKGEQKRIFDFYLKNTKWVNNWDLVDLTAPKITGEWLINKDKKILYGLAGSKSLWERRIAILSTFTFLRKKECKETFKIAEMLLCDKEELIHKAVGWMLREAGKRCSVGAEKKFLTGHLAEIPRITLRYAIERFPESEQARFLKTKSKISV